MVVGPWDTPFGTNGCFASATRSLPSELTYFCAVASEGASNSTINQTQILDFIVVLSNRVVANMVPL
jgi:hypothetical protein